MYSRSGEGHAEAVLARLSGLLDELHRLELSCLTDDDVLELLRGLGSQHNRLASIDHRLVAELESRGIAREHACRDTATLLHQLLRITPHHATARVRAAADLGPRRGLTGQALPPIFGAVAAAQASGAISPAHARVITATIDKLPAAVHTEHEQSVQDFLVDQAHTLDPRQLAQLAHRLRDTLDPDGTLASEKDRHRHRDLRIRHRPDGSAQLEGELTAICAEALTTVLDTVGKPAPAEEGTKDPRTAGQRNHDALHDAMMLLLRSNLLPDCNGIAATILITITEEQFQTRTGLARTGHGAHITTELALSLLGDARVMPVVLGKTREITAYGTTHRIFTEGQRLAMIARDQGCSFPACDQPPSRCQSHHITDYTITRRTSVDDGALLCGYHHREHPKLGWTCHMTNGTPHWTPPHWIDPTETPQRNRTQDQLPV
ncbi:MAG: hypothetical protein DLM57_03735 [Pseudonocardiales bacterium]|nr:MAG: hypothetical protein DLM57_03735 [Pseudonocardiales bacterium]